MFAILRGISRFSSPIIACSLIAAVAAGCEDRTATAPAILNAPRLNASIDQGSSDLERRNCDTIVTIAVNDWVLPLAAGQVPPAPDFLSGQAFFQGTQAVYAAGLLYGTSPANVVIGHDVSGILPNSVASGPVCVLQTKPVHHTIARLKLATGAAGPAGLVVKQESFAYPSAPDNGYVLLRYTFTNTGDAAIPHFYSGWLADWDVLIDGSPFTDAVRYDGGLGLGEATESDTISFPQIFGIVPVGPSGPFSFRGWSHHDGDDPATLGGYFAFLAGGVNLTVPAEPTDIREMMGLAPLTLAPGQSTVAYFAIVGGADRAQFTFNVAAARAKATMLGMCGLDNESHAASEPRGDAACDP